MSENIIETSKNGTAGTEKPEKKHSGLSGILNKYFHHIDRGGSPVSIGQKFCAGVGDNAKSGLASVAASVGFFLSMFVWIIPAVFVTAPSSQIRMNLYGHHGKVLQLVTECSFGIADAVMGIVGLSMVKHSMDIDWKNRSSSVSLVATIAGTFFLSNAVYGVALGCMAQTLLEVLKAPAEGRTKKDVCGR